MRRTYRRAGLIAIVWLLMLLPFPVWAACPGGTCWASPGDIGAGNCNGTSNSCDLQQAFNTLGSGDTLIMKNGTYNAVGAPGNVFHIPGGAAGTSGARTQIRVDTGATVSIKRGITASASGWYRIYGGDGTLIFDGDNESSPDARNTNNTCDIAFDPVEVISIGETTGVVFERFEAKNGACGIFGGRYHNAQFLNLNIHHAGIRPNGSFIAPFDLGKLHAIYADGFDILIDGGEWHTNDGCSIHRVGGEQTNWRIQNVNIHSNTNCGIILDGPGHTIINNIVRGSPGLGGILVAGSSIYNNTVLDNSRGIGVDNPVAIRNNIAFNNSENFFYSTSANVSHNLCESSGNCAGTNQVITSNPGFVNTAAGNFRIALAGSPAVNAALNLSHIFTTDADGLTRPPPPGNWTIGAYEFDGGGPIGPLGLVQWLKLNNNTLDSSPNGFNGTVTGVLTYGAPIVEGNSGVFNGVDTAITSPNNPAFRPPQFGMSLAMNTTTLPPSGVCRMMSIGTTVVLGWNDQSQPFCYVNNGPTITGTSSILTGLNEVLGCSYNGTDLRLWRGSSGSSAPFNVGQPLSYGGSEVLAVGGVTGRFCPVRADNVRFFDQPFDTASWQNIVNEVVPSGGMFVSHVRYYADAAEGTPLAAVDADLPVLPGVTLGIRFAIHNTGAQVAEYFPLWCSRNASAYVKVSKSFGSLGLRIADSAFVDMGQATTVPIPDPNGLPLDTFTPVPGQFVADTPNPSSQRTIGPNQHREDEYRVETGSPATGGDFFDCVPRRESDVVFNAYNKITRLTLQTLGAPTSVRIGGVTAGGVGP
jgi:hypothetical protein